MLYESCCCSSRIGSSSSSSGCNCIIPLLLYREAAHRPTEHIAQRPQLREHRSDSSYSRSGPSAGTPVGDYGSNRYATTAVLLVLLLVVLPAISIAIPEGSCAVAVADGTVYSRLAGGGKQHQLVWGYQEACSTAMDGSWQ